jgi:hypothetical protein
MHASLLTILFLCCCSFVYAEDKATRITPFADPQSFVQASPASIAKLGITVVNEPLGSHRKITVTFPEVSSDGSRAFASVAVAYPVESGAPNGTVSIPQSSSMAIAIGSNDGLKKTFVSINYSKDGRHIKTIGLSLADWVR